MLVLTRKRNEMIKIGSNIVIKIIKTGNGSVKIGVDAPSSVRVTRGEIATPESFESAEFSEIDQSVLEACELEAMLMQS